jgi:hypothetical protein
MVVYLPFIKKDRKEVTVVAFAEGTFLYSIYRLGTQRKLFTQDRGDETEFELNGFIIFIANVFVLRAMGKMYGPLII